MTIQISEQTERHISKTQPEIFNNEKIDVQPLISRGWLRAIIGTIGALIMSGIIVVPLFLTGLIDFELFSSDAGGSVVGAGKNNTIMVYIASNLGIIISILLMRKYIDRKSISSMGLNFNKRVFTGGLLWGAALLLAGFGILYLFGAVTIESVGTIPWLSYIALFAFVAIGEEVMVRGYLLSNLTDSMNKYWALLISSAVFSIMHFANDQISVISAVNLLLAGLLLGIYTVHKRDLWFPIGMHFTWNFFQGPIMGFEVSGMPTHSVISQTVTGNPYLTGGEFGFEGSLILTALMTLSTIYLHNKYKTE